jgi:hypothetical protein
MGQLRRDYKLGPFRLITTPSEAETYPDEDVSPVRLTRRRQVLLVISHLLLVLYTTLYLLYILIPYHLSGFGNLTSTQIEWSNLWLWEYTEYPLYAPGASDTEYYGVNYYIVTSIWISGICSGTPLFLALAFMLLATWSGASKHLRLLQIFSLLFAITVQILALISAPYIPILVSD